MVKPFHLDELMARIRVLVRGKDKGKSTVYELGDLKIDIGKHTAEGAWSALDSEESQNEAAMEMKNAGTTFYFTVLSGVVPEGISDNDATEHMNTWRVAYSISEIRNWLFEQVNE